MHNHLRSRGSPGANFPADINIIRSYGRVLARNEDAFLQPLTLVAQPSLTTAEELKRRGERARAELEHDLRFTGHGDETRAVILNVFAALWEILSLYEASDGYNCWPDTGGLDGAEEYFDALLKKAREAAKPLGTPRVSYGGWQIGRILDETERFVKSYSIPGVDLRWRMINSRLNYYDPVFDMIEEFSPERFRPMWHMFSYRPTQWDIQTRRQYFSALDEEWGSTAKAYFQEELLDTLIKIFRYDFFEFT